jgi:alcohol dehydrogenase
MKAAVFHQHGDVSGIVIEDFPEPTCGPDDVIIQIFATSLNGFDPMIIRGSTSLKTPFPMVPCGDYAGEIVELGKNVSKDDWNVGDRVCPHPFVRGEGMTGETRIGSAAELARIPAKNLVKIPDNVSFVDAASLPIAYCTAYRMMQTRGRVSTSEQVLILGATGGVGTCCVQLAKAAGAVVIATGSADWKLEKLKALGADHVIDTSQDDFVKTVYDIAGKPRMGAGGGVDVVINYIGGETWVKSLKCLTPNGRMLTCGATAGYDTQTDIRYIWTYEQNIIGSNGWKIDEQVTVLDMVSTGKLKPVIHSVRPLDEIVPAMQDLFDRKVFGKSILQIGET